MRANGLRSRPPRPGEQRDPCGHSEWMTASPAVPGIVASAHAYKKYRSGISFYCGGYRQNLASGWKPTPINRSFMCELLLCMCLLAALTAKRSR
jgi:hypothetical protein